MASARKVVDGGSLTVIATAGTPVGGETTVVALAPPGAGSEPTPTVDPSGSWTIRRERLG
jgi:transcription termination factor Rho